MLSKIRNTSQIWVFMYLRYLEQKHVNKDNFSKIKYIFYQNRERLSNMHIHVFEVFITEILTSIY